MHFKIIKAEIALLKKPSYPEVHRAESGSPLVPAPEFHPLEELPIATCCIAFLTLSVHIKTTVLVIKKFLLKYS